MSDEIVELLRAGDDMDCAAADIIQRETALNDAAAELIMELSNWRNHPNVEAWLTRYREARDSNDEPITGRNGGVR